MDRDEIRTPRRTGRIAKRTLAVRCVAALIGLSVVASACSSGSADGGNTDPSNKRIAIVMPDSVPGYPKQIGCGAYLEGKRLGYDVSEPQAPPKLDVALQAPILESALAQQPAGLIYDAADGEAGANAIRAAVAGGLPVVTVDTELSDPSLSVSFVSSSHEEGGQMGAELLADQIGGSGEVAIIGVIPSHPITRGRVSGFEEGISDFPDVDVVDTQYPDFDEVKIASATSALLSKHPNLAGIYTTNDTIASGVASALRSADKTGEIKVVTWDLQPVGIKLLQDGDISGTVVQQPRELGKLAMQQLANHLEGKDVEEEVQAPLTVVTSDEINDPEVEELYYTQDC